MNCRAVFAVEDDPFPRMPKALLDPDADPARLAALSDFEDLVRAPVLRASNKNII